MSGADSARQAAVREARDRGARLLPRLSDSSSGGGAVSSVNGRTGAVAIGSADVTDALGFTPQVAGSYQAQDADLTALAALVTDPFGRGLLTKANAADIRSYLGAIIGQDVQAFDADLAAIAALATTAYGRALLELATSAALTAAIDGATTSLKGLLSGQDKTRLDALHNVYRTLLDSSGSHIAARVAGTYGFAQGQPLAITGTGTLYALNILYIDPADYPAVGSLAAKLRVRCSIACNDVAPTGNFTVGLHPVTRPATSGGAGLAIYTIGAAVAGSTVVQATPAADSINNLVGADFNVPAAGFYVLGLVTTATVVASAHVHLSAALQMRYA